MNRLRFRQARDKGACGARIIIDDYVAPRRIEQAILEGRQVGEQV
jgi:hypothetical protein